MLAPGGVPLERLSHNVSLQIQWGEHRVRTHHPFFSIFKPTRRRRTMVSGEWVSCCCLCIIWCQLVMRPCCAKGRAMG